MAHLARCRQASHSYLRRYIWCREYSRLGTRHSTWKDVQEREEAHAIGFRWSSGLTEQVFLLNLKTCIDSLFMCDAATGGRPSFRREDLNGFEGAINSCCHQRTQGLISSCITLLQWLDCQRWYPSWPGPVYESYHGSVGVDACDWWKGAVMECCTSWFEKDSKTQG